MSHYKQSKIDKLFNKKSNYLRLQKQKESIQHIRPKFISKDQKKCSKENSKSKKRMNSKQNKQKKEQTQTINFLKQTYLLAKQENEKIYRKLLKKENKIQQQKTLIQQLQQKLTDYEFQMKTKANTIQQYQPTFCSTQKQSQSHHNRSFSSKNIQNSNSINKSQYNICSSSRRNKLTIQSQQNSQISKQRYEHIIKQLKGLSRTAIDKFKKLELQNQQLSKKRQLEVSSLSKELQNTKNQLKKLQNQNYNLIRQQLLEIKQKNIPKTRQSRRISKNQEHHLNSSRNYNIKQNISSSNKNLRKQQSEDLLQKVKKLNKKINQYETLLQLKDQKISKLSKLQMEYSLKQQKFKNMLHQINSKVNNLQKQSSQYQQNYIVCNFELQKYKERCANTEQKLNAVLQKYKAKKNKYKQNQQQWQNIFTQFLKEMVILQEENIQIRCKSKSQKKLELDKNKIIPYQKHNASRNSRQKKVTFVE